jgi:3-deoxy-D-manno-octulosonic-acid transferase
MYFVYSVLLTVGLFVLSPYFLFQAWRHGKYLPSLRERLGKVPAVDGSSPVIWLHCVSVGETQAARPLADALRERFPAYQLVVSTTTLTGQQVARDAFAGLAARVIYFPFDWRFAVRRALDRIEPSLVLIMETELWPNFLRECGRRQLPVAIVNGRLSAGSFRNYARIRGFMRRVLANVQLAAMQSPDDGERIGQLGLPPERRLVTGNIKFDAGDSPADEVLARALKERFGFDAGRPLVIAASTHEPEEEVCLQAWQKLATAKVQARLLIAPRHPERFADVAELLERSGFTWTRRSVSPRPADRESDVILLDSIGELRAALTLGEIVFVGGSIAPTGGHNVLEPAALNKCIVTGSHTFNFNEIMRVFGEADALVQLPPLTYAEAGRELARTIGELLADPGRRRALGERAGAVVVANRGATRRTIDAVANLIGTTD